MRCRYLIIFLAAFVCFGKLQAQKFSLGAKAGLLMAYPNFANALDHQNTTSMIKPGFSIAGLIIFPLKRKYAFVSEVGFTQQGRAISFTTIGSHKNISTYNFIELSMGIRKTFRLKIKENIPTNWFVNFGPNINYWLSGRGRIDTEFGITQKYTMVFDKPPGTAYDKMYINNENRWLFGLNLGVGFTATTKKNQRLLTELRLTWGQTYLGNSQSASWNNLVFQGQQSLKFNLKVLNFSVGYIFDKDLRDSKKGKSTIRKRLK